MGEREESGRERKKERDVGRETNINRKREGERER